MLHQPTKSFEPASTPPAIFDPRLYITRARELGLIIFPSIFGSGKQTYGLTTPGQKGFSSRNLAISEEFSAAIEATPNATALVFKALCDDLDVDPADTDFNKQVNAICRREDLRRQGDRKLMAICKRAEKIVAEDYRLENRLSELTDSFMQIKREHERPAPEGVCCFLSGTSQEMRTRVKHDRARNSPESTSKMLAYIRRFAAWELEIRQLEDRHGLTAARRESRVAGGKTRKAVVEITAIEATTTAGLAAKCRVMTACMDAGYGYDSQFEALALSIFEDGRRAHEDVTPTAPRRRGRVTSEPCAQQVHH